MAKKQPKTLAEFGRVAGVGNKKLEQYGEKFVKCINEYLGTSSNENIANVVDDNNIEIADEDISEMQTENIDNTAFDENFRLDELNQIKAETKDYIIKYDLNKIELEALPTLLALLKKGSKKGTLTYDEINKKLSKRVDPNDKYTIDIILKILDDNNIELIKEKVSRYIDIDDTEHFEKIKQEILAIPDVYISISDIIKLIGVRLQAAKANDYLTHIGYLETIRSEENKIIRRDISQKGTQAGIISEQRIGRDDIPYFAILFPQSIILEIIDSIREIVDFEKI